MALVAPSGVLLEAAGPSAALVRPAASLRSPSCRPALLLPRLAARRSASAAASVSARGPLRVRAEQRADSASPPAAEQSGVPSTSASVGESGDVDISKGISKAVKKTASTFAPRASTKTKNPAVPGSMLYRVFEIQAYACMALGGVLSFNLVFPSDEPDLWRLMGMWSVWMFTIPSLRARDCSDAEKTALNYLFLLVPIVNVTLPIVWKSFAAVWSADVLVFAAVYAWKLGLPSAGGDAPPPSPPTDT